MDHAWADRFVNETPSMMMTDNEEEEEEEGTWEVGEEGEDDVE